MNTPETRVNTSTDLSVNARARYLTAKRMFQTADSSETPNSQALIEAHEQWLIQELGAIGIDARNENLYVIFRDGKVSDKKHKPAFRRIETQVRASANNILQGLLWYEAPEYASWQSPALTIQSSNIIAGQQDAVAYMLDRKRREGWRIADYNTNPMERHKSLIVGYYPLDEQASDTAFTLTVNEHYPGVRGSFDYTNSRRKHIGVDATFDPEKQLFTVGFNGYSDFIGWDQIDGEEPVYRLSYARDMVRDLSAGVKSGEPGIVQLSRWRAY